MSVLAIESSCDESAVAIFDPDFGVRESLVHSQIDLHALYGGVVPDLASSEHLKKLPALIAKISKSEYFSTAGEIAATNGPGLPNCLAIGVAAASALALKLGLPLRGVNHLRGHAYSPFIPVHAADPQNFRANFAGLLPHLGLAVSGGNTILFEIGEDAQISTLAETEDDAAGEALDKGAKLLGMPYPARRFWKSSPEAEKSTSRCFPTARTGKSKTTPISASPDSKRACATASKRWRRGKSNAPSPTSARPTSSPWWSSCAGAPSGSRGERPTRASACRGASQTTRPSSPRSRGSRAPAARASSPPTGGTGATTPR